MAFVGEEKINISNRVFMPRHVFDGLSLVLLLLVPHTNQMLKCLQQDACDISRAVGALSFTLPLFLPISLYHSLALSLKNKRVLGMR